MVSNETPIIDSSSFSSMQSASLDRLSIGRNVVDDSCRCNIWDEGG